MTTYTNVHGVHEAIAAAVRQDTYERVGDISVTALSRSPQQAYLERVHRDEIVEDVSEALFRLMGQAMHMAAQSDERLILELLRRITEHRPPYIRGAVAMLNNWLSRILRGRPMLEEHRLTAEIEGWEVSGRFDVWMDGLITDYKWTSVWTVADGAKEDWHSQINFYALLARLHGIHVERGSVVALLRDWHKSESRTREGYPPIAYRELEIPLWSQEQTEEALIQRVRIHQMARNGDYSSCTPTERWARPDIWAVKKRGNKRALPGGLHESEEAAQAFANASQHPTETEFRRGESVRCLDYCRVSQWCPQWAALRSEEPNALDVFQQETRR